MIFTKDIKLYGKHAALLKKYSKDKQAEEQFDFTVVDNEGNPVKIHIFDRMLQGFMVAAMIGICEKQKIDSDTDKNVKATMFQEVVSKNRHHLNRIAQFLILTADDGKDVDLKIKEAFTLDKDEAIEKEVIAYARYGLEVIDSYYNDCKTQEEVIYKSLELNKKYSVLGNE